VTEAEAEARGETMATDAETTKNRLIRLGLAAVHSWTLSMPRIWGGESRRLVVEEVVVGEAQVARAPQGEV